MSLGEIVTMEGTATGGFVVSWDAVTDQAPSRSDGTWRAPHIARMWNGTNRS